MGGPWRDRNYTPSVPSGVTPAQPARTPRSAWVEAGDDVSYLSAYAVGLIVGSILTLLFAPLWLRWLPLVQP